MLLIHISDSHIAQDKPGRAADLTACVAHINNLLPKPDAVIHTGDITQNGRLEEYASAREILNRFSMPYFVVPGNRDDRCNLASAFDGVGPSRAGMNFVQYAIEDFPVRLIAIDPVDDRNNKGRLCGERLAHVKQMLVADRTRQACLFLHHPPFDVTVGPDLHHFDNLPEAKALVAEFRRHSHIEAVFCGHVHRSFRTSVGPVSGNVVSCLANDLRWDKPEAALRGLPVYDIHNFSTIN